MSLIKVGVKLIGVYFFSKVLVALINTLSVFSMPEKQKLFYISLNLFTVFLFFIFSILLIKTPKWLINILWREEEKKTDITISANRLLMIGMTLIGFSLLSYGAIDFISYIFRYILLQTTNNTSALLELRKDFIDQIESLVSITIGVIMIIYSEKLSAFWKSEEE